MMIIFLSQIAKVPQLMIARMNILQKYQNSKNNKNQNIKLKLLVKIKISLWVSKQSKKTSKYKKYSTLRLIGIK